MQLTKAQTKLVNDAQTAGYKVEVQSTCVDIYKKKRNSSSIDAGIRLCEDGTAFRIDINLGSALTIRTQKQMRVVLGI